MATTAAPVVTNIQNYGHNIRPDINTLEPRWLAASPYLEQEHLLDLNTLDVQSQLFALALTKLEPATIDYATVKYEEALNLEAVMTELRLLTDRHGITWQKQGFYLVEFRSKLMDSIDNTLLFRLDKESHREATASGGLLKYWFGVPNGERRNLATCESFTSQADFMLMFVGFWRHKDDAIRGGRGPWHKQARMIIPQMYEDIIVKGLRLIIEDGIESWTIGTYQ